MVGGKSGKGVGAAHLRSGCQFISHNVGSGCRHRLSAQVVGSRCRSGRWLHRRWPCCSSIIVYPCREGTCEWLVSMANVRWTEKGGERGWHGVYDQWEVWERCRDSSPGICDRVVGSSAISLARVIGHVVGQGAGYLAVGHAGRPSS
jgi:hypothetical protein